MFFRRTKLRPREQVTTTTEKDSETTTEMPYPEERRDEESHEEYQRRLEEFHRWDEGWLQDQRERRRREKAYLEARGPLSLLQAVYCDPCKAKVLSSIFLFCFQICHLSFFICLFIIKSFRCSARS